VTPERQWTAADGAIHLELRGLQPPLPLVTILRLLHGVGRDAVVVAHLERDPVMLYPELDALGWRAEPLDGEPGEVRLRLVADGA
jgi:Uncharacterized conserved protein (DUF2249)